MSLPTSAPTASPTAPQAIRPTESSTVEPAITPAATIAASPTMTPTLAVVPAPAAQVAGSAGLGDPYYPLLGNGGYNVLHYTLDLSADVASNTLAGTTTIQAKATQDLASFNLDFEGFTLRSVTVQGAAASFSRTQHELTITPVTPLQAGQTFTAAIAYAGIPQPVRSVAERITVGWTHYPGGSYVVNEPEGAATWFPVNDHPRDKAIYTFRVTVPKPYSAAANGLLLRTIDHGSTTTYVWETLHPMASYLATVDIGKFVIRTETGPGKLPIRSYFPFGLAPGSTRAFNRTREMISYFSSLFGPYPLEAYGVVVPDQDLGFALETQTLSVFGRDVLRQSPGQAESTVAHELVHQWYGDSVSVKNWKDIWLNEGFATFGEWLWLEHTRGPSQMKTLVRSTYANVDGASFPAPGSPPPDDLFNPSVYLRGALTLEALRLRVGDDVFFRILKTYAQRYKDRNASTGDFIVLAQAVAHRDLTRFFNAWLYGSPLPPIPEMQLVAGQ